MELAMLLLEGQKPAVHRMSERDQQILERTAQRLRTRRLMKDYHLGYWDINEVPAPVLDDMLALDAAENAVIENARTR